MPDQAAVPEAFADLLDAPVATLATVAPDNRPQLSAVWFLHDGGELKVSLHATRQKTRNLRRNPAVNLFVLDPQNPMRTWRSGATPSWQTTPTTPSPTRSAPSTAAPTSARWTATTTAASS